MSNTDTFTTQFQTFRAQREEGLATVNGPLAPVGFAWLDENPVTVTGTPGRWSYVDGEVIVDDADGLVQDGVELTGRVVLGAVDLAGVRLNAGETVVEVAQRGPRPIVRPRDPNAPLLTGHTSVPTFEPDEAWVITGPFEPHAPEQITVGAVLDGLTHHPTAVGTAVLDINGTEARLVALDSGTPGTVSLSFTDETSGESTWKDMRVVTGTLNAAGDEVTVDFNRALNQPCAFTDHATCPLPPKGNHIPVAVTAGEKTPANRG